MSGLDKKASYALSQSVRSSKQAFENYRALDNTVDQYCRLGGALNPESSDTAGRDELMGIFNSGYQGKSGLDAIKQYLTDMYDRSINPDLDANKSDSQGGRKDSIRKCFGFNVRDPILFTNNRIDFGVPGVPGMTIGSSRDQFNVPSNPGISPAHCMFEVGSPDSKNIWGRNFPAYEANAPPLGNGVYWIWGTSDGWSGRPLNEAYSFYYNFINTGSSLTATLAGGIDDRGYVKINDTLYDNLGTDLNIGVSIQPREVQIKRGVNLIEIRSVNTGGGPTGVWLTITTNNNILVKTACDGWRCTRVFYPAEVFHVNGYNKTLADAPAVCQSLGARVATYAELKEAQMNHANWCSTGWVSDQGDRNAFFPITYEMTEGCGTGPGNVRDWIGNDDWFTTWADKSGKGFRAGVNCFGNKLEETTANKMVGPNLFAPQTVLPYNKNQWSRYSPGTSPPFVPPTLAPVRIYEHCDGAGWSKTLTGPKVFSSGADYPSDVSFIRVPAGVTVVISYNGRSFTIVGPNNFNACGANKERGWLGSGDWYFNDRISTIEVRATGSSDVNSVASPPPAPPRNINIKSASYGVNCGAPVNNVTTTLQNIINRQTDKTSFSFTGGLNSLFGDPAPGCGKALRIMYDRHDGNGMTKNLPGIINEYHSFTL
jgi:Extracellular link domain